MENEVLDAPVASPAPAPAPAAPSLRDTLEAAVAKTPITADQPDRDNARRVEGESTQAQRVRDNQGRFQRKNADGSEVPSEQQIKDLDRSLDLDPNAEEPESQQAARDEVAPSTDNAPKSWKGVAKERWASVDPVIRAEVHRRERDMQRAIQEGAPSRKFVETFGQTIQPFAQHYSQSGIQPMQLFQNLMQADVHLSTAAMPDRARFMAKLIKDYKVDVNMLDAALAGQDPAGEPMAGVDRLLNERLAPIHEFVQTEQQRRQQVAQAEQQRAVTVLDRMAQDAENFPHFNLVAQDMADITEMALKRRVYLTPQQAYARAVAMNPEAQAAEQSRSGQQRAQSAHDAATRSLGASLSVSGAPAALRQQVSADDLRGTIEAAWNTAQGR